jgi:prevent-host-death family protein
MASSVGAFEAKTHLSKLLDRVSRGERITITKHGVPVAVLAPPYARDRPGVVAVIQELRRFRVGRSLKGLTIRQLIDEGRRR